MSLTISFDDEALAALDSSASFRNLSREETVREAVMQLARYDACFRAEVEAGLDDIRAGRVISDEEMDADADALLAGLPDMEK